MFKKVFLLLIVALLINAAFPLFQQDSTNLYKDTHLTLNKMGSTFPISDTDIIAQSYLASLKEIDKSKDEVLEIGAGFGPVSYQAINQGIHAHVNDLCQEHLNFLKEKLTPNQLANTNFLPGSFPDNVNVPDNHFARIYSARVLHFLEPPHLKRFIKKMYKALKKGGEAYVQADTRFMKGWEEYNNHVYIKNKAAGMAFPGFITNVHKWQPALKNIIPDKLNFLDEDVLVREFEAAGFEVIWSGYFGRPDYPDFMKNDGKKESIGIIVRKLE